VTGEDEAMAIGSVIERTGCLFVYDERGRQISTISVLSNDELRGYTGSTVSVQRGSFVFSYDEQGRQMGVVQGGR